MVDFDCEKKSDYRRAKGVIYGYIMVGKEWRLGYRLY
jgi:hypothetical protein